MKHLLRKVPISNKQSLIRLVALATAGSGLFFSNIDTDSRTIVSISSPLRESLSWPWRTFQETIPRPSFVSLDPAQYGLIGSVPSADISNKVSGEVGDGPKPCCGCLGKDTIANAAAMVGPAVVNLSVPQGFHGLTVGKSIGSGTIIDSDGTILTCAHVVVDFQGFRSLSKGKVDVTLQDGRTFEGTVLNADLHSDIAIVKIKSKTPLPMAKLGTSSKLRPGDWVIAMGCPLSLQNTITAGIVSCVDRKSSDLGLGGMRREYLQTDCAINSGNSGGPLVNIDGEVIGVNIMKVLAADGLSFSVPIDSVSTIIEHFKKSGELVTRKTIGNGKAHGGLYFLDVIPPSLPLSNTQALQRTIGRRRVVRPWLGLKMLDLNDMIIAQLREKDPKFPNVNKGVLVPMVSPGSPADRAGFRPGDVVVEFEGRPVGSIKEITEIMGDKVGKPLKVIVKRANDTSVTLTVIPEEANPDINIMEYESILQTSCKNSQIGFESFDPGVIQEPNKVVCFNGGKEVKKCFINCRSNFKTRNTNSLVSLLEESKLTDFMGGSHNGMVTLENRVRGLEKVVEDMARDLSISSGRRGSNFMMGFEGSSNRPSGKYNGFPDYSGTKLERSGDGWTSFAERYTVSDTDSILSAMRGRGPPWRSDVSDAWDFHTYGKNGQMASRRVMGGGPVDGRSPKSDHESDQIGGTRAWNKGVGPIRMEEFLEG
ncbi:unnamed protein product [Camellia sinensis]